MSNQSENREEYSTLVVVLQYFLPVSFTMAMVGTIVWIVSLLFLSAKLDDVFSASMGVSIVAIPVFLVLLSVFWFVFLGIIRNQEPEDGEPHGDAAKDQPGGKG